MDELLTELVADTIEFSKYSGYPEWILGAIKYISETERSKLRTDIEISKIIINLPLSQIDEARIIQEFQKDIVNNTVTISLTSEKKSERIHLLIEPISRLFSQRNSLNPKELEKLEILRSPNNTSEFKLIIHFGYNKQDREYFIRNIRIQKDTELEKEKSNEQWDEHPEDTLTSSNQ